MAAHRRRAALVCVAFAALLPTVLGAVVKPLHEGEPGGESIIDFELAGSVDRADEILATWRREGVIDEAKAIQIFDLIYPLSTPRPSRGVHRRCGGMARARRPRLAAAGIAMAWVAFAAAGFDYVENLGLGISLWGHPASPWPQLAFVAAVLKFAAYDYAPVIDPLKRWDGGKPDYAGLLSFSGVPYTEDPAELANADVAIVGAPTDDLVSDRPGARFGPRAIRAAGCPPGPHLEAKVDGFAELRVVDYGDAPVMSG